MPKLGLIGYPLTHTFSPTYFAKKFKEENILNWEYDAYSLADLETLMSLWEDKQLYGLNVTIPYKEKVMGFLDEIDETALSIGAVNTIKKKGDKLVGYNTDAYGFEYNLKELLQGNRVEHALILGTGGASKAVEYVLTKMDIQYHLVSRNKREGVLIYQELDKNVLEKHHLIVNTTPLGTYPNTNFCPDLNYNYLNNDHYLMDLVYNPPKTLFLTKGEQRGAKTINGLLMLHLQAERAWDIWTDESL